MNTKEIEKTRKKYIAKYKEAHDDCLERMRKNPAISEIVWEGYIVHLMVRDFVTHITQLEEEIAELQNTLEACKEELQVLSDHYET